MEIFIIGVIAIGALIFIAIIGISVMQIYTAQH